MVNETSSPSFGKLNLKYLILIKERDGDVGLEDILMEEDNSKKHQGSSVKGMFTTLLEISQDTAQVFQRLAKDSTFVVHHELDKGISNNNYGRNN